MAGARSVRSVERIWTSREDFEMCTRDAGVDNSTKGVRLARTVMIQDELGRTHINNVEELSDKLWARKDFMLDSGDMVDGRAYFYCRSNREERKADTGGMHVTLNGRRLRPVKHLVSTGWCYVNVPASALEKGLNSFVFSGAGRLLVENSKYPDRSARSTDGGKTWDYDALGRQGMNDGEYLVRLRLNRYPNEATLTSEAIDFAALAAENGIFPEVKAATARFRAEAEKPKGSALRFEARTAEEVGEWSPWLPVARVTAARVPRYFQWRAVLGSKSGDATALLKSVMLRADVKLARKAGMGSIKVTEMTPVSKAVSSYMFAHQQPFSRLQRLRKQYRLDKVVAGHRTELDRLAALRDWCRHTAPKGWDKGRTDWCPPWDALVILETNKVPLALCMCTHYSTLFVQTAVALGYTARHVILDHHCVAEVWCNELRKWVLMDTGNADDPSYNSHFESNGVPLSALDVKRLWQAGHLADIDIVYRQRDTVAADKVNLKAQGGANLELYRRFCVALRNNHLETPFPGELTHGHGEYFCDVYLWWEDGPVPADSPEYGLTSNREADLYWPVNETAIELYAGTSTDALVVDLKTNTPNFEKFMVKVGTKRWQERKPGFTWKLKPGRNAIQAKSVNSLGVSGPVSKAVVQMG